MQTVKLQYYIFVNVSSLENARCIYRCVNGRCDIEKNTFVCSCFSGYTGTNCTGSKFDFDFLTFLKQIVKSLKEIICKFQQQD